METKYPNTLVSSREDKKLAYAGDVYSKYFHKSIEDKVMDLDNDNYTIKSNIADNKGSIDKLEINVIANGTSITNVKKDVETNKTAISDLNKLTADNFASANSDISKNSGDIKTINDTIAKLKVCEGIEVVKDRESVPLVDYINRAFSSVDNESQTRQNEDEKLQNNINTNTKNISTNSTAIKNLQVTTQHITDTLSENYYSKSAVDSKISSVSQNTWCTSELIDCTDTTHAAYVFHIRINKSAMNIHYITSVTIKLRTQLSDTLGNTSCVINNGDGSRLGVSKNLVHQYNNTGQYVTWYFDPIVIPTTDNTILLEFQWEGQSYAGQLGIHVNGNKSEGVTCQDQNGNNHSDWCPALGFNVTPLVQLDLYNKFVSLNS
jgi:hypothetical protein